jgi:hypothetical protein
MNNAAYISSLSFELLDSKHYAKQQQNSGDNR